MASHPHFVSVSTWKEAATHVDFEPRVPGYTAAHQLRGLAVYVRDHKLREVDRAKRSLEAHYGGFVLSQSRPGPDEATRLALEVRYGPTPYAVAVAGFEGRAYEAGPPVEPDDVEGRLPAVVVWAVRSMFYLLASTELDVDTLLRIAGSVHRGVDPHAPQALSRGDQFIDGS